MKYYVISVIFTLILCLSCKTQKNEEIQQKIELPDMVQVDYEHYIYKNNRVYLEAFIGEAKSYEKKNQIVCQKISAQIYNTKNQIVTKVRAEEAVIDNGTDEFCFRNDVVVEKVDQDISIYTEELVLNYKANTLVTEKELTMKKKDGSQLKAKSMRSDLTSQITDFEQMDMLYYYDEEEKE